MKSSLSFLLLLLPATMASWSVPRRTDPADPALFVDWRGVSPRPTSEPELPLALFGRRASGMIVAYVAPDNTCGFASGISRSAVHCPSNYLCFVHHNPNGGRSGAAGCTNPTNHHYAYLGTCVPSVNGSVFTPSDPYTIGCTASERPYCYAYTLVGLTAGMWLCDSVSMSTGSGTLLTTYEGEDDQRSWKAVYLRSNQPPPPSPTTPLDPSGGESSPTTSIPSLPPPLPPPLPPVTSSDAADSDSSVPVGAIAGSVVGGLAVICLCVAGVVFLCLRSRRQRNSTDDTSAAASTAPPPGSSFSPISPMHHSYPPGGIPPVGYYPYDAKQGRASADVSHSSPPTSPPQQHSYVPYNPAMGNMASTPPPPSPLASHVPHGSHGSQLSQQPEREVSELYSPDSGIQAP